METSVHPEHQAGAAGKGGSRRVTSPREPGGVGGHPQHRLGRRPGPPGNTEQPSPACGGSYCVLPSVSLEQIFLSQVLVDQRAERSSRLGCLCRFGVSEQILLSSGSRRLGESPKWEVEKEHSRSVHTGQRGCCWHPWGQGTAPLAPGHRDKEPLDGDAVYVVAWFPPPDGLQKPHQLTAGKDTH